MDYAGSCNGAVAVQLSESLILEAEPSILCFQGQLRVAKQAAAEHVKRIDSGFIVWTA